MRQFVTAAFLAMATMTASSSVQARPPSGGGSNPSNHNQGNFKQGNFKSSSFKNYHLDHGKKFSHGYYYSGKNHYHWSHCCYWPQYRCDCYYCPSACCWYYWCEPRCCYLPVSYIESAPPVRTDVIVQNTNTNTNTAVAVNGGSPGVLSGGLPVGPGGAGPVQPFKGPSIQP